MNYKHDRFLECMKVIFHAEGGLSDDPEDRGGRTNLGITQGTLDRARKKGITAIERVDELTREEAGKIYRALYWDRCKCGQLPLKLDLVTFDCAVNCGTGTAGRCLQRGLADVGYPVTVDGAIGKKTITAVSDADSEGKLADLLRACLERRRAYYAAVIEAHPEQKRFGNGWENRVKRLERIAEV